VRNEEKTQKENIPYQGDQKIGEKMAKILEKVAKTVAKTKHTKIPSSKLYLKVQNIYIRPLLNS
jgi:hypothetical protein